jgi:hypothetical protein
MNFVCLGAVLGLVFGGSAHALTVNFNNFATGAVVGDLAGKPFNFGGGLTGKIKVDSKGAFDVGMIFDTNNPTGGDTDLRSPFTGVPGTLPQLSAGKALIISEDGDSNDPDDEAKGGLITFLFDTLVNFESIDLLDTEANGNEAVVSSNLGFVSAALFSGDGKYTQFKSTDPKLRGISSLTVSFGGSGALDNLTITPVPLPAGLVLMLTAVGGAALLRRRQTRA